MLCNLLAVFGGLAVLGGLLWSKVYAIAWEIGVYGLHSSDASESGERHVKCGKCRADLSTGAKEESSRRSP